MIYAIVDTDGYVTDVIIAEPKYLPRLRKIFPSSEVVQSPRLKEDTTCAKGYYYNKQGRYFVPFKSWTANAQGRWVPPVARPNDGNFYRWDEATRKWIKLN